MSFFSKLFKRSKPTNWQEKVSKYLNSHKRVQKTVEKELDILFALSLKDFANVQTREFSELGRVFEKINIPKGNIQIPDEWKNLRIRDFLSIDTQEQLIHIFLQPGPHPKLEIFQKILGQKEISIMIATQLQAVILEVNKKLNPFSSVFKSTGWEDQMYKIIEGFVPGIQNSIAEKLAEKSGDERLQEILRNTVHIFMELSWNDFLLPSKEEWELSEEAGRDLIQKMLKDEILLNKIGEKWSEIQGAIPPEWLEISFKELFFTESSVFEEFRSGISDIITDQILSFNQQTKYFENSLVALMEDIDK